MTRVTTHPGEVLAEEFIKPMGLSARQVAQAIDVPANRLTEIMRGKRAISAETALRLAKYFGTTAEFWANLQMAYDLSRAKADLGRDIDRIRPREAA